MDLSTEFLVIGAGPSGLSAALVLAKSGKKVTIVAKDVGGKYCSEGYIPFNAMLEFAMSFEKYRIVSQSFIEGAPAIGKVDMKRLRKYIDSITSKMRKIFLDEIDDDNIEFIEGSAVFLSEHEIAVLVQDKNPTKINFKKCLIATGSENTKFEAAGGRKYADASYIARLENIPSNVIIIGGGIVGVESALVFSRLGAKVTIIEKEERVLSTVDQTLSKKYDDLFKKRDITVKLKTNVSSIERVGQKYIVFCDETKFESEEVIICIGRSPFIESLNIEAAGVNEIHGVPVFGMDLRTDNDDIFVAGDITNVRMHVGWAYDSAVLAAENMMGASKKYDPKLLTSISSQGQDVISIGLSESEAKEEGYEVGVIKFNKSDIYLNSASDSGNVFLKAIYDKSSKVFLGFQVMGYCAFDVVSLCSFIIQSKIPFDKLGDFTYIRPIFYELFKEISDKVK